ncbi:toxin VasX [Pseudomonas sp. dw_612]|uniref:toxin VasX n=1 Tax=Pseudomonas sp. dw_612 TaxID=2720080 RepID=UPI001BD2578D|nr:toxin VasX [Pseudomonas sp. dw_612]
MTRLGKLTSGPGCERDKLIVQVIGTGHSKNQRLLLVDHSGVEPLQALTDEAACETERSTSVHSELFVWDWSAQLKHQLWLEIATIQGPPIRLPLLEDVRVTPRQLEAQWNQIVPALPFAALPGTRSKYDLGTPVLCRSGYVYVFYRDRLWRELEVRQDDELTTYRDIDLQAYRLNQAFSSDYRQASGVDLSDIWLPATWNHQPAEAVQLCFSEIQLSAARLKRLEEDPELRAQRCQSPALQCESQTFERLFDQQPDGQAMLEAFSGFNLWDAKASDAATKASITWRNLAARTFPVSLIAPQRARQSGFEYVLEHPGRYVCDLSGQFAAQRKTEAKACLDQWEQGATPALPATFESSAWADCLATLLDQLRGETPNADDADLWQPQPTVVDVLEAARQRRVCGVLLEDPRHRVRHLVSQIQQQQQLLTLYAERASLHPHHASAVMVQQLIVPATIGGQKNPLHACFDKVKEAGRRDINHFTATAERALLWQQLNMAQTLLAECLQQPVTQQTLADHLSLDGFDYLAALFAVSQVFASLATVPAQLDPLARNGDVTNALTGLSLYSPQASVGQTLLNDIAHDPAHPLHGMLWPAVDEAALAAPYVPPTEKTVNEGDGCLRAQHLAEFETDPGPYYSQVEHLDGHLLEGLLASGSLNSTLTGQSKAAASTLVSIYENLAGAVETASGAVNKPSGVQGSQVPTSAYLHGLGVGLLRSLMPKTFGEMHFINRRDADPQRYYLFGLSDVPAGDQRPRRVMGEYLDAEGRPLTARNAADVFETPSASRVGNYKLLVMPVEHPTVRSLSALNQRINAVHKADVEARVGDNTNVKGALQQGVDELAELKNSRVFRVLNSLPFAAGVLMLEVWNVRTEWEGREQVRREKGQYRSHLSVFAAGLDLAIALEMLTVKFAGTESVLAAGRKVVFKISDEAAKTLGTLALEYLVTEFTVRLVAQITSGLALTAICLTDAWYAWVWGDDASWGYLMMAVGGAASALSGLVISTVTFLELGPAGWVALILILIGAGLAWWLTDKPIEEWLINGPFGTQVHSDNTHLLDPQRGFYYLISLFADIRINIGSNPEFVPNAKHDIHAKTPFQVISSNTCVRIESNLPGLISKLGTFSINAHCRLNTFELKGGRIKSETVPFKKLINTRLVSPKAQRLIPQGLELFFETPPNYAFDLVTGSSGIAQQWQVKAQCVLEQKNQRWHFPAPPLKDGTPFDESHKKPNFDSVGELYWADELTNKSRNSN